jgi:four helix bundle protein
VVGGRVKKVHEPMTKESDGSWKVERVITSFEDLEVYKKLVELHLEVHQLTLRFPKYEMYELGSQLRRSSNSIPANIAEGWNNKHSNIYLEGINRALGELRKTKHHVLMAFRKRTPFEGFGR